MGFKILFSSLLGTHVSFVKKELGLKLKTFVPQTPFSIHSSHGMETSVVKKTIEIGFKLPSAFTPSDIVLTNNQSAQLHVDFVSETVSDLRFSRCVIQVTEQS